MRIGALREVVLNEARVAMTPESAIKLQKLGHECLIQSGAGSRASFSDTDYESAGVRVVATADQLWSESDIIIKVREPLAEELADSPDGKTLISFITPSSNGALLEQMAGKRMTALALDMVPRISRAQKMDALSSMANIAGYRSVIEACNHFDRFLMGQMTAAGKVPPARVLVVGAGVAGLSAIGTAVSLGAITLAFDVRPEVSEQIESMGAEFVFLEFDELQADGAESGGYASPSSPEFAKQQIEKFLQLAPSVDIVITTALIPNRPAPLLWTADMVNLMRSGSVVVDLAAERGGNCELTVADEKIVTENGVTIIGFTDFPSRMASQSSSLLATNIRHMIDDLTPQKDGAINVNIEDDVIRGSLVSHQGEVTWPPPPPKVSAIAAAKKSHTVVETAAEKSLREEAELKKSLNISGIGIIIGSVLCLGLGTIAPSSFMQHLIVFVLSIYIGFHVIWGVAHSLHTPLMAITNAISSIIIVGAILQIVSSSFLVVLLASISVFIASVNIFGGFLVTRRMLAMFQRR
ncbi:MAG: Re/Si-specific NAD(P)(+) transhydrogenase subunit alpha [Gammaproteobacteria bacterium]|nr:Re/Si-specific NAD(P)(+) transhydrogenase subunit alpha [Gammaproteobacteria bacterium]